MLLFEENWEKYHFLAVFFTDGHRRNVHSAVAGHGRMNILVVAEGIMGSLIPCFNWTRGSDY